MVKPNTFLSHVDLLVLLVSSGLLVFALLADISLPPDVLVTPLYTLPIIVVAFRFNWRAIVFATAISLFVFTARAMVEELSLINFLIKLLFFITTCALAVVFSFAKASESLLTKEAMDSKHKLQTFMEMVSHDLIQPITTTKLYAHLLTQSQHKDVNLTAAKLLSSVNHLQFLVNDLREAASISGDHFSLKPKQLDLLGLLTNIVDEQQATTDKHHLSFRTNKKYCIGHWDENRLQQVFTNLISNAIKYSPDGGNIKISLQAKDKQTLISIIDSGIGISPEDQEKLFQPFMRVYRSGMIKGMGLGLYICKMIVEAHDGKIWVKSKKNKGSKFYIQLPLDTDLVSSGTKSTTSYRIHSRLLS